MDRIPQPFFKKHASKLAIGAAVLGSLGAGYMLFKMNTRGSDSGDQLSQKSEVSGRQ